MGHTDVLQYIGDLVSPFAMQFGLRLLTESSAMEQVKDWDEELHKLFGILIDGCRAFDGCKSMTDFQKLEKPMFTAFHAVAAKIEDTEQDEFTHAALTAMEDGLRQFRTRKRQELLRDILIEAIISQNVDKLSATIEKAGPQQRWAMVGRIVLKDLVGDGPSSLRRSETQKYDQIRASLVQAESALAAATKRANMLENENSVSHDRYLKLKRDFRELESRNETLEPLMSEKIIELSPRMRQAGTAKLEMEAAQRSANMLQAENEQLQAELDRQKRSVRDLNGQIAALSEKLETQQNVKSHAAIRRVTREYEQEKRRREKLEREMAYLLKEQKMQGQTSDDALAAKQKAEFATAQAKAAMENAKQMKKDAKEQASQVQSQLGSKHERINQLEYQLQEKDEEIESLRASLQDQATEVRAEGDRELLRQQAEVARLKTMMEWKAKIVEDDVKFRTESGWRERTKMLISEIEHLRKLLEGSMMEKSTSDAALQDLNANVAQKDHTIQVQQQQINNLNAQLQTTHHLRDSVMRLQRATEAQWRQVSKRDDAVLRHLESELHYFQHANTDREYHEEPRASLPALGRAHGVHKSSSAPVLEKTPARHSKIPSNESSGGKGSGGHRAGGGYSQAYRDKLASGSAKKKRG